MTVADVVGADVVDAGPASTRTLAERSHPNASIAQVNVLEPGETMMLFNAAGRYNSHEPVESSDSAADAVYHSSLESCSICWLLASNPQIPVHARSQARAALTPTPKARPLA